jgi:hypothetical protein
MKQAEFAKRTLYHQHVFVIDNFSGWVNFKGTNSSWCAQARNTAFVTCLTPPPTDSTKPMFGEFEPTPLLGNTLPMALGMELLEEGPISDALLDSNNTSALEVDLSGHEDDTNEELESFLLSQRPSRLKAWLINNGGHSFRQNQNHTAPDYVWRVMRLLQIIAAYEKLGRPNPVVGSTARHIALAGSCTH